MKKILLCAATLLASAGIVKAQAPFTVSYCPSSAMDNYSVVNNGETLFINNLETEDEGYWYVLPCYLQVENNTGSALEVSMTVEADESATTLTYPDGVSFCTPAGCAPGIPFTSKFDVAAGETAGGVGFHIAYDLGGINQMDELDLDSPELAGTWVGKVTVAAGGSSMTFTLKLSHNDGAGIGNISADRGSSSPRYYNLQGIEVVNPQAGNIYIVTRGNKVSKEFVK